MRTPIGETILKAIGKDKIRVPDNAKEAYESSSGAIKSLCQATNDSWGLINEGFYRRAMKTNMLVGVFLGAEAVIFGPKILKRLKGKKNSEKDISASKENK